ncbi:hypothetical protein Tco_1352685 [Tanacetum coccineum]
MFVYVPELSTGHPLSHRSISRNSTPKPSDDTLRKRHMMVKRRHGKCAAQQLVLFLKAKSDTSRVGCVSGQWPMTSSIRDHTRSEGRSSLKSPEQEIASTIFII